MQPYTLDQLKAMPTIRSGPANDLKIDTGRIRVWVRRAAGEPAIVVQLHDGVWEKIGSFTNRLSVPCQRLLER